MRFLLSSFLLISFLYSKAQQSLPNHEIDFVSDTQQPMEIEKLKLHANHNLQATAMIFSDILKNNPLAVYMLGDIVALGYSNHKWHKVDQFIDSCRKVGIAVHGLLGNHDVMFDDKKGEKNFTKRFPDNIRTGYIAVTDSVAVVLLNSNFKKLSVTDKAKQLKWYESKLAELDRDDAIKTIIVCCHHSPYSNSLIVGSSVLVQKGFVPAYLRSKKCSLFISGHSHNFEHFKFSGKNFLVIGGGGGLHQPLDTSAKSIPDIAHNYKPMFHYLSIQRETGKLLITSTFLKNDFSGFAKGYSFEINIIQ
jgi:UDP-2,3-diacylglucosamine pyrophosphatase LpxH